MHIICSPLYEKDTYLFELMQKTLLASYLMLLYIFRIDTLQAIPYSVYIVCTYTVHQHYKTVQLYITCICVTYSESLSIFSIFIYKYNNSMQRDRSRFCFSMKSNGFWYLHLQFLMYNDNRRGSEITCITVIPTRYGSAHIGKGIYHYTHFIIYTQFNGSLER